MNITKKQLNDNSIREKADYYDQVLKSGNGITTTIIAKEHGISARKLNSILHTKGIIFKSQNIWVLYSKYESEGYQGTFTSPTGRIQILWTQKGRKFIHDVMTGKINIPSKVQEEKFHQITMEEILNNEY